MLPIPRRNAKNAKNSKNAKNAEVPQVIIKQLAYINGSHLKPYNNPTDDLWYNQYCTNKTSFKSNYIEMPIIITGEVPVDYLIQLTYALLKHVSSEPKPIFMGSSRIGFHRDETIQIINDNIFINHKANNNQTEKKIKFRVDELCKGDDKFSVQLTVRFVSTTLDEKIIESNKFAVSSSPKDYGNKYKLKTANNSVAILLTVVDKLFKNNEKYEVIMNELQKNIVSPKKETFEKVKPICNDILSLVVDDNDDDDNDDNNNDDDVYYEAVCYEAVCYEPPLYPIKRKISQLAVENNNKKKKN